MGESKAGIELGGRPLISYPVAAARAAGLEPLVVAKAASALPQLDCAIVTEPDEPTHPLTGIIAALEHVGEPIVAIACDLPLLPPDLLAELASRSAPLAMPANPRPQPLVARYSPELLPRLRAALVMGEPLVEAGRRGRRRHDRDDPAARLRRPGGDLRQRQRSDRAAADRALAPTVVAQRDSPSRRLGNIFPPGYPPTLASTHGRRRPTRQRREHGPAHAPAGRPRRRLRRGGGRGTARDPGRRQAAGGDDADARQRRRAGARIPPRRGPDRRGPRRHAARRSRRQHDRGQRAAAAAIPARAASTRAPRAGSAARARSRRSRSMRRWRPRARRSPARSSPRSPSRMRAAGVRAHRRPARDRALRCSAAGC